jgi:ATP-dependent Lon protease
MPLKTTAQTKNDNLITVPNLPNTQQPQAAPAGFDPGGEIQKLQQLAHSVPMPAGLQDKVDGMLVRLQRMVQMGSFSKEFEPIEHYINWITRIPWSQLTQDNLELQHAAQELNRNHYGLQHVKDMVLEYLAVMKLQTDGQSIPQGSQIQQPQNAPTPQPGENMAILQGSSAHAPVMCFVGIQGVGKTSIAKSIASALGRKFSRVALGAMGSVTQIRGQARIQPNAEPGQIVKSLVSTGTMNPVILLDEIDKTSSETGLRADLMAALLEILDPEQNATFVDHYIDYPIDLSRCIFITTANNLGGISAALLDRLEVVRFGSYTDEEKIFIAKDYMLPKVRRATGISEQQLTFDDAVWPLVVRPLGFDAGVRQLERTITILARKVARLIVEGKGNQFHLTSENFRQFIPEDIGVYS